MRPDSGIGINDRKPFRWVDLGTPFNTIMNTVLWAHQWPKSVCQEISKEKRMSANATGQRTEPLLEPDNRGPTRLGA